MGFSFGGFRGKGAAEGVGFAATCNERNAYGAGSSE